MKRRTKYLISALVAMIIVPSIAYAEGAVHSYSKNVTIHYGIKVTRNGQPLELIDSNGKRVDAFIYEDTAYVPLKTLAPILGGTTQYTQENNTVNITESDSYTYINGYLDAIRKTPLSSELEAKILSYGYTPTYFASNNAQQNTDNNSSTMSYEEFFLGSSIENNDQYLKLATEYYNMGKDRMEEINNGTATNNEAWQEMYESMGKLLESMGQLPELPNNSMNKNTNYTFPLHLYSNDGKVYLGKCVTDEYDDDSIWYGLELAGDYSSPYGTNSIWNKYGEYGGTLLSYSNSAFNDKADTPPIIVDDKGVFVAYLTTNEKIENGWTITELRQFVVNNNQ